LSRYYPSSFFNFFSTFLGLKGFGESKTYAFATNHEGCEQLVVNKVKVTQEDTLHKQATTKFIKMPPMATKVPPSNGLNVVLSSKEKFQGASPMD
jgi:hypothetical protein